MQDGGAEFTWEYADPGKLLPLLIDESPVLSDIFARAVSEHRPTLQNPWDVIITFDEFCPGNKLRVDNRRKCMNLCMSFKQLGQAAVSQNWVWMNPVCLRSSVIRLIRGGWSHCMRQFLRHVMLGPIGLSTVGVPITLKGQQPILLYAKLGMILSDGDGLRQVYDWTGSASLRPCLQHYNIWKRDSDIASRSAGHHEITCHDDTAFLSHSSGELSQICDMLLGAKTRMESGEMTRVRFERLELINGLNTNPFGMLFDPTLREHMDLLACLRFDWMHNLLQDGILVHEVFFFLRSCGVPSANLRDFLRDERWTFPLAARRKSSNLHMVFDDYRSRLSDEHDKLKANASEVFGLYGMLRHDVSMYVPDDPTISAKRDSWNKLCECMDIILLTKRGIIAPDVGAEQLRLATMSHLRLHKIAYGTRGVKPKNHWQTHVPSQIRTDGIVFDAFLIERCHVLVKSIADNVKTQQHFERSVLAGVLNVQMRHAQHANDVTGLRGRSVLLPGFRDVHLADRLDYYTLQVHTYGEANISERE